MANTYNQSAIESKDREEYIKQYSKTGALRAGFDYNFISSGCK